MSQQIDLFLIVLNVKCYIITLARYSIIQVINPNIDIIYILWSEAVIVW